MPCLCGQVEPCRVEGLRAQRYPREAEALSALLQFLADAGSAVPMICEPNLSRDCTWTND